MSGQVLKEMASRNLSQTIHGHLLPSFGYSVCRYKMIVFVTYLCPCPVDIAAQVSPFSFGVFFQFNLLHVPSLMRPVRTTHSTH